MQRYLESIGRWAGDPGGVRGVDSLSYKTKRGNLEDLTSL
jgi:hypothetical protein